LTIALCLFKIIVPFSADDSDMLFIETEELARDMMEVDGFPAAQKGYGILGMNILTGPYHPPLWRNKMDETTGGRT
jgi:hypothetical protein